MVVVAVVVDDGVFALDELGADGDGLAGADGNDLGVRNGLGVDGLGGLNGWWGERRHYGLGGDDWHWLLLLGGVGFIVGLCALLFDYAVGGFCCR